MAGILHRTQTASITNCTVSGGLSIALMLLISFESRVLSASSAFLSLGLAIERSFSQSYLMTSASLTFSLTIFSSMRAFFFLGSIAKAYADIYSNNRAVSSLVILSRGVFSVSSLSMRFT